MPGPLKLLERRNTARAHYLREVGRDLGHRLVVLLVVVFLLGLLLRVSIA